MNISTGKRIRERRESLGMSQDDLAKQCGLKSAVVSHYETDRRNPSLSAIRMIACALRCTAGDLIDDIESPLMVVCPACSGHGAIPDNVYKRMSRDNVELSILRSEKRKGL